MEDRVQIHKVRKPRNEENRQKIMNSCQTRDRNIYTKERNKERSI